MTLFKKGKADQGGGTPKAPAFSPIDRFGLLGLLDQVVNGGQSGVLELHEPRGNLVYAFQAGALTHASGGRRPVALPAIPPLAGVLEGASLLSTNRRTGRVGERRASIGHV